MKDIPPGTPASPNAPIFLDFHATKTLHTAQGPQQLNIRFQQKKGSLLSLYGPSGAGKTTLLRILAGLTETTTGTIKVGDDTWLDTTRRIHLPTRHRAIGMVFQDFALFPNLTVRQQIAYALPKRSSPTIIDELLSMMELEELQHRKPAFLSGGQQQRVALARAIARRPKLLLLDEPLSALDDEMRHKLQDFILKAHRFYELTTILVSHHLPEIIRLSDDVIAIEKGLVRRQGPPADIFPKEEKFKTTGEIIDITADNIVSVLAGGTVIKIAATTEETNSFHIGQKVIVTSKTFHPIILPLP